MYSKGKYLPENLLYTSLGHGREGNSLCTHKAYILDGEADSYINIYVRW